MEFIQSIYNIVNDYWILSIAVGLASAFVVNHFKEQILSIIRKLNNYNEEIL